jgi:hypothetical protein
MIASTLLLRGFAEGVSSYRIFGDKAYPQHLLVQILETGAGRKSSAGNKRCLSLFEGGGYGDFCKARVAI